MRRRNTVSVFVLLLCLFIPVFTIQTRGTEQTEFFSAVSEAVGADRIYEALPDEVWGLFQENGIDPEADGIPGLPTVLKLLFSLFLRLLAQHKGLISSGLLLLLFLKLISAFSPGTEGTVDSVGYLCVVLSGVYSFSALSAVLSELSRAAEQSSAFLTAVLPVFVSSQAWAGQEGGAALFSLTVPFLLQSISLLISGVYYPLCWFCFSASVSGFFSGPLSLRPLIASIRKFCTRGVEILSGLSVGLMAVQKVSSGAADSLSRKSLHFALSELLPVAGGALSDGMEAVYSCGKSLSGQIGALSVIVLGALFAVPCVLGFLSAMLYGFLAAAGSVFSVPLLTDFFSDLRDTFALTASFGVCALIVLSVGILILAGG